MVYHLLTGSTGLLGSYLLRDALLAGRRMAVLVRPSREPARLRVENLLTTLERDLPAPLPRPVVLEGDICQPRLGLDAAAVRWVAEHCQSVLHSAASLTFQASQRSREPWESNVGGTQNVLDLCREAGIRHLHHVSTAYVCGLRSGRVLESELDVDQTLGNDYEKTKVQAEKLVRGAEFLDSLTVYRPAIIVGDSRTGYTTTFHGFYTPLKILHALVKRLRPSQIDGKPLLAILGFSASDRKNFVPVDWVSAVISFVHGTAAYHGKTYHLVPREPTKLAELSAAMEAALLEQVSENPAAPITTEELHGVQHVFRDQMEVYRAYWRNDPDFDAANTQAAAGHLPCPGLDNESLIRLARYALRSNFGWPRPAVTLPPCDVDQHLHGLLSGASPAQSAEATPRVGLQVNGRGGGQWTLTLDGDRLRAIEPGLAPQCQDSLYLNSSTFRQLLAGERSPERAIGSGQVLVEGRPPRPELGARALRVAAAAPAQPCPVESRAPGNCP